MTANPPHLTDWSIVSRMKRIWIEPGKSFDFDKLDPAVQKGRESAAADGMKAMLGKLPTMATVKNGWQMNTDTMGVYGNYYLKRAIIALVGLGANQPEDAVYPLNIADADDKPMDGSNKYLLHFEKTNCRRLTPSGLSQCMTRMGSRAPIRSTVSLSVIAMN